MGYLELSWWYSKPASVEDKEQPNVPLNTAPLFASSQWECHTTSQILGSAGQYCGVSLHYSVVHVARTLAYMQCMDQALQSHHLVRMIEAVAIICEFLLVRGRK